jgi:hypothetical protein
MLSQDIAAIIRAPSILVAFCRELLMVIVSHQGVAWLLHPSRPLTRSVLGSSRAGTPQLSHNGTVQ